MRYFDHKRNITIVSFAVKQERDSDSSSIQSTSATGGVQVGDIPDRPPLQKFIALALLNVLILVICKVVIELQILGYISGDSFKNQSGYDGLGIAIILYWLLLIAPHVVAFLTMIVLAKFVRLQHAYKTIFAANLLSFLLYFFTSFVTQGLPMAIELLFLFCDMVVGYGVSWFLFQARVSRRSRIIANIALLVGALMLVIVQAHVGLRQVQELKDYDEVQRVQEEAQEQAEWRVTLAQLGFAIYKPSTNSEEFVPDRAEIAENAYCGTSRYSERYSLGGGWVGDTQAGMDVHQFGAHKSTLVDKAFDSKQGRPVKEEATCFSSDSGADPISYYRSGVVYERQEYDYVSEGLILTTKLDDTYLRIELFGLSDRTLDQETALQKAKTFIDSLDKLENPASVLQRDKIKIVD